MRLSRTFVNVKTSVSTGFSWVFPVFLEKVLKRAHFLWILSIPAGAKAPFRAAASGAAQATPFQNRQSQTADSIEAEEWCRPGLKPLL
jgi:hypothetical protein